MKLKNENIDLNGENYRIIIIPEQLIDIIKEKLGDEFIWDYDKKTGSLFLMKRPKSYTEYLSGLGEEMWKKAGGTGYIRQERDKWDE